GGGPHWPPPDRGHSQWGEGAHRPSRKSARGGRLVLAPRDRLARDELAEAAQRAVSGLVLVHEGELVLVERLEPHVPVHVLQGLLAAVAREVDPEDPRIVLRVARPLHARGRAASLLDPLA